MTNTVELLSKGMDCLRENLGEIEAEMFISTIIRERFDYTRWHRDAFEHMDLTELNQNAANYEKKHPYDGKAKIVY